MPPIAHPDLEQRLSALEKRIEDQDEWAGGVWQMVFDLVEALNVKLPGTRATLLAHWQPVSRAYALARADRPHDAGETIDRMEPRALMHDILQRLERDPRSPDAEPHDGK